MSKYLHYSYSKQYSIKFISRKQNQFCSNQTKPLVFALIQAQLDIQDRYICMKGNHVYLNVNFLKICERRI